MQQRSEETRLKILSNAEVLFARKGYDATGVQDICRAANLSKGAFYHHFPTKLAVFQALLESWLVQLDAQLDQAILAASDVPSALLAMAAATGPVFEGAGPRTRIILEFWIQAGRRPDLWNSAVAPYQGYLNHFASLLERGSLQNAWQAEVDPRVGSRVIIALAMGLLLQSFFDPAGADWSELTVQGMQILINGLTRGAI
jgi:TetR/AcrR family transcriptional regulator, repressor for uid operon